MVGWLTPLLLFLNIAAGSKMADPVNELFDEFWTWRLDR